MRVITASFPQTPGKAQPVYYRPHLRRVPMEKVINCPCGFVLRGKNDDEVVQKAQEHAKSVHGMDLSRQQALEMARPA